MDEKRYQVFVSSTYRDLLEHRQLVMKALLQVNAIPAGMELFPASDDDAWTLIQHAIDESDYYVVIVGGRYGSVDKDGVSYTEREFDYASDRRKPIMAFLHGSPATLPREKTETDHDAWEKLERFREKAQEKHCKYWSNPDELTIGVLTSYHHLILTKPAVGWVRGDRAKTIEELEQLAKAQQRVRELETELDEYRKQTAGELSVFAQGEDNVTLRFQYRFENEPVKEYDVAMTWDDVFRVVGGEILDRPTRYDVAIALERHVIITSPPQEKPPDPRKYSIRVAPTCLDLVKVQFVALRLITVDHVPSKDMTRQTTPVWKLTSRGCDYLARLTAVRRTGTLAH